MAVRIGELLLKEKRITAVQLQEALNYQKQNGGKLGANLVKMGFVKDDEITALLSKQYGVPSIALNQFEIDQAVIKLVPAETARKYQIIPLSRAGATLTIAMTDPTNVFCDGRREVHDRLQRGAGGRVRNRGARRRWTSTTALAVRTQTKSQGAVARRSSSSAPCASG